MGNYKTDQPITFWEFLKTTKIVIPIIQRDYAQGRLGKEYLRKRFLSNLKNALDNKHELKLDFVYGSTEGGKFYPLDGQQRLTTLWLLHWYVALMSDNLNEKVCKVLEKFTYETRISSREFCRNLCNPSNFENYADYKPEATRRIIDFITSRTWFYSAWKQDPTIQAMLRMLGGTQINDKNDKDIIDGLEELFPCPLYPLSCDIQKGGKCILKRNFQNYWHTLTDDDDCPIVFYNFPLKDFGLSDDLYIKMNARGKQLTPFENFKADLIGYIKKRTEEGQDNEEKNKWSSLLVPLSGIPIQMDKGWTDIFWKNRSVGVLHENGNKKNANKIDEIYFAFINRFFWNELFISKDKEKRFILDVGEGIKDGIKTRTIEIFNPSYRHLNEDRYELYLDFSPYLYYKDNKDNENEFKRIPFTFFKDLMTIMSNYAAYEDQMPICKWNMNFHFIPQYETDEKNNNIEIINKDQEPVLKVSSLNQIQRIVFFAVCKYFKEGKADTVSLKRWMRVVWNLVSGEGEDGRTQIRNTDAMRKCIEFIDRLDSHNVYNSLDNFSDSLSDSAFDKRCKEEIDKAKQILRGEPRSDGKSWEDVIIEAEEYAFFKGAIRFLFQDANGHPNWDEFDEKWENGKKYFAEKQNNIESIMNNNYDNATLLKALISRFSHQNYWDVLNYSHRTFNNKPETWMYYLLNDKILGPIHQIMMGETNIKELVKSSKEAENRLYQLSNTNLLDYVIEKIPNSWIRGYHGHTAIFPSSTGVFLDAETRDHLLTNTTEIKCKLDHLIENTNFLFGTNIDFEYSNHYFQWYAEPNDKELDVYLMNDNWDGYKERPPKDDNTEKTITDEDTHYCFRVEDGMTPEQFLNKLDDLINEQKNSASE